MKHTKGNWYSDYDGYWSIVDNTTCIPVYDKKDYTKIIAFTAISGPDTPNEGEAFANAKLIAAAPELLEALITVSNLQGFEEFEPYGKKVLSAIKKATE